MANLRKLVYLTEAQKDELFSQGTVTSNNVTITYDENDLYVTPDNSVSDVKIGNTSLVTNGIATIPTATTSTAGLISATDKTKLDGITSGAAVTDVQINSTSILNNGIANIPYASDINPGVVKVNSSLGGIGIVPPSIPNIGGILTFYPAATNEIKTGSVNTKPIVPGNQHEAVFYGLSNAAGVDLASETVTVGTYPATAQAAIRTMLGAAATSDIPVITGKADKVTSATSGNFAGLDANGNLTDSGSKASDFLTSHQDISGKADKVSNATSGNFAALDSNGNLVDSGHTHSDYTIDFTGATASAAGAHGLVPAPAAGDDEKFLKGDGTWADISEYDDEAAIAAQYDPTQTYAVGDLCFYDHVLYVCSTAISTAEEWDSTHWTVTSIDENKAPKANPVFTGSISMGRQANSSIGYNSVATGTGVQAIGPGSHAEGNSTIAYGEFAHVEGVIGIAKGNGAHVEGGYNVSSSNVTVTGDANATTYSINQSIAVGCAIKKSAKVAGTSDWAFVTNVSGTSSPYTVTVNETLSTSAMSSVSCQTNYHVAYGLNSHIEGAGCTTFGAHAHAEGAGSKASGDQSHAEGAGTLASGPQSHAEGAGCTASGTQSHAEGTGATASGAQSHAEGSATKASGVQSHAEGTSTIASGTQSHAEGAGTTASNAYSHSEGLYTTASGVFSHAEGYYATSLGSGSHAEGYNTYAMGMGAHVEGGYSSSSFSTASFTGSANATSYTTTTKLEVGYLIYKNLKVAGTSQWAYITSISGTSSPYTISVNETLSTSALSSKSLQYRKHSASGNNSHAEGLESRASGNNSHAEGNDSYASGHSSHTEGAYTKASGDDAHAEGVGCEASGFASHSEGASTKAIGTLAHSEGSSTLAYGTNSHAEGLGGDAYGSNAHVEGYTSTSNTASFTGSANATTYTTTTLLKVGYAVQKYQKADGTSDWAYVTSVTGDSSPYTVTVNETLSTSAISSRSCYYRKHVAYGANSHAEGSETLAYGANSHAEGESTVASGTDAHAEGYFTVASSSYSHAEGYCTEATNSYAHAEGYMTKASASQSHAEGSNTKATQSYSHAEGYFTEATGYISHAEGDSTKASAGYSHAEGSSTTASGTYSHAEGKNSTASASVSHAEGQQTTASGTYSHTEGYYATATGEAAHAEGYYTIANGSYQHVGGIYNVADGCLNYPEWTANTSYTVGNVVCRNSELYVCKTANSDSSFTTSKWTLLGTGEALEIIGNGSSNARSNARELDRLGNERLMGDVYVGCNPDSTGGTKIIPIPSAPVSDGTYYLQCVVASGVPTMSWVTIPSATGVSF